METITTSIDLLRAVRSTMDGISIAGIENQDKFVGCASALQTVCRALEAFKQKMELQEQTSDEASELKEDEHGG